jgi:hypothetical protein
MATPQPEAPRNVVAALAAIKAQLPGIDKLTPEERRKRGLAAAAGDDRGVSYAFRGIEQIEGAVQRLSGELGVVWVPRVVGREVREVLLNNKPWTDTWLEVEWTIYGPGGPQDYITATTVGLGRDNSDKGINKAMTGAAKNLLLRMFDIGDPADDTDGQTHVADARPPAQPPPSDVTSDAVEALMERVKMVTDPDAQALLRQVAADHKMPLTARSLFINADLLDNIVATLDALSPAAFQPQGATDGNPPTERAV